MSRLTLALTLAIFTFFVTAAYATVDSTPPADWDYGSHDVDETDPEYEIVWTGELGDLRSFVSWLQSPESS
ncbi:hypothetical protein K8I61_12020 [bacterium]|nr:hypothetical protein [bacterium]